MSEALQFPTPPRSKSDETTGRVSLVGAGPGDPELLTLKGLRRLREADVVVHDALSSPELLAHARPDAEIIDAGKRARRHRLPQDEIETLLVDRARRGLRVVRLKGGDPYVFGRGGEERAALLADGVEPEVVPGVSSATAAAAAVDVPVTHRGLARSFAVITATNGDDTAPDWASVATIDTVVVLMVGRRVAEVAAALLAVGRDDDEPAVVVSAATTTTQDHHRSTLGTLAREPLAPSLPATLVIGRTVALADAKVTPVATTPETPQRVGGGRS
ncbi:MAG: uroporphyrinogen-III C-methyltransferase [Acidobacteriota bacterium]